MAVEALLLVDHSWGEEIAPALIPAGTDFVPLKVWKNIPQLQANFRRGGEAELWVGAHNGHHGRDCIGACHQNYSRQVKNSGVTQLKKIKTFLTKFLGSILTQRRL